MLPTKSNTVDAGCTPVSSNCVVWQGPDIPCINLCTGDTVSSVVYKVANSLCTIQSSWDLSDLDLSCLLEFCSSVGPAPTTRTLSTVLDYIVKKICCLNDAVEAIPTVTPPTPETAMALPVCLQIPASGSTPASVTMMHREYTLHLATRFCSLKATVDSMSTHEARITALEGLPSVTLPKIASSCLLPGSNLDMNVVLKELETQYCLLRTQIGTNSQLTVASAAQCTALGASDALGSKGKMSDIPGWTTNITNLAQSFQNLWLTVCDMRAAIAGLKDCCSTSSDCSDFILGYQVSTNQDRTEVYLEFNGLTSIPSGFTDAPIGTKVTISNEFGKVIKTFTINNLTTLAAGSSFTARVAGNNPDGTAVASPLNPALPYIVMVEANIIKGTQTCSKSKQEKVSVTCAIINSVTATLA